MKNAAFFLTLYSVHHKHERSYWLTHVQLEGAIVRAYRYATLICRMYAHLHEIGIMQVIGPVDLYAAPVVHAVVGTLQIRQLVLLITLRIRRLFPRRRVYTRKHVDFCLLLSLRPRKQESVRCDIDPRHNRSVTVLFHTRFAKVDCIVVDYVVLCVLGVGQHILLIVRAFTVCKMYEILRQ